MNSIVHFEIHASDPEKLAGFYREVFGWDIKKWDSPVMEYWVVMTAAKDAPNAINGGLLRRKGPAPAEGQAVNAFVCTVNVQDIDDTMTKAAEAGAKIAAPKMPLPGMAWIAYLKDPDGNILGVHQTDPDAK